MRLLLDLPAWWLVVCLLAGLSYAGILYFKNKNDGFGRTLRIALATIRVISIFLIAILLLNPVLKLKQRHYQHPNFIILNDNSRSVASWMQKNEKNLGEKTKNLISELSDEFECDTYDFGDSLRTPTRFDYKDASTDISSALRQSLVFANGKNLSGIVLISDGITNEGTDPLLMIPEIPVPVYTIGIGDTSKHPDLKIVQINANSVVSRNNSFPVEIALSATECNDRSSQVIVFHNNQQIFSEKISIKGSEFSRTLLLQSKALKPGINKIRVEWIALAEEQNKQNNKKEFYFNVVEDKKKILIVYNSPHPDVNAIKEALQSDNENEVFELPLGAVKEVTKYNLIILHQLPSLTQNSSGLVSTSAKNGIPVLWIIGTQSNINAFNQLNTGLKISGAKSGFTEMQGTLNDNFQSYQPESSLSGEIRQMPALNVPFGNYEQSPAVKTLIWQRLGKVTTSQPLIATLEDSEGINGVICGEGLWRWRMNDFQRNNSHESFDAFFGQYCRYLMQNKQQSRFRIIYNPLAYFNRNYTINAELLNNNRELFNTPDIELLLRDVANKEYHFLFSRDGNSYHLDLGRLPAGEYSFNAKVLDKNYPFNDAGRFAISKDDPEMNDLSADFALLRELSGRTGGKFIPYSEIGNAASLISKENKSQTTYTTFYSYADLISWKWLLPVIIFLLTIEWVVRKREGLY